MAGSGTKAIGEKTARAAESAPKAPAKKQEQTLWQRLQRRDTWPRSWWYPEWHEPSQKLEATEAVQKDYEQCVATVRRTMLVLLGFCLFAIVVTFGTPDSSLIASDAKVKLPFAESDIEFLGFLIAAPALLIILILYLHIFDTSRRAFESKYDVNKVTTLFTHDSPLPRLLTYLIFYWLVPLVLVAIAWKASARLEWGLPLITMTIAVTAVLVWMQIRRCPSEQARRYNRPLWAVMIVLAFAVSVVAWEASTALPGLVGCATETAKRKSAPDQPKVCRFLAGLSEWHHDALRRPLNLFRADLSEKWLANADLRDADLRFASLAKANLQSARLQRANLTEANLQRAVLNRANLQGADLYKADIQGANLREAKLQGASLSVASLQGTVLRGVKLLGARLVGADLRGADLLTAELQGADLELANLHGANLAGANLQGALLHRTNLLGADLRAAKLQGADLREAKLQGADLAGAEIQGADLSTANVWLAAFPSGLPKQTPAPRGLADLVMPPMAAEARAELRTNLQSSISDAKVRERVIERLDLILRKDLPNWEDKGPWEAYVSKVNEPSTKLLVDYLVNLACGKGEEDETKRYIAVALMVRATRYFSGKNDELGRSLASTLVTRCKGIDWLQETRGLFAQLHLMFFLDRMKTTSNAVNPSD